MDNFNPSDETRSLLEMKYANKGRNGVSDTIHDKNEQQESSDILCWGETCREFRHSACMMRPLSVVMILLLGMYFFTTLLLQCPVLLLGFLLAPVLNRNSWYVEFLYSLPVGRWAHFLLMSFTSKMRHKAQDKNRGFHSRTIEQKIEVVPGRVYIHFLPQWLDNIGYLVVCLPEPTSESSYPSPPVGFVIDCGELEAVVRAIELIQDHHYDRTPICVQSILSTHKHWDHTGGNSGFLQHPMGNDISKIFGGAVEKVPCCTDRLVDGDKLMLPSCGSNDMNEFVECEAIAVPAHTRGSLVYCLRSKFGEQAEYMFTGDTMFSGGGGVPFEADVGVESEKQLRRSNGNTHIRGNIGKIAMERCFTEIMSRAKPNDLSLNVAERILIFPGHEYTQELLIKQFHNMVEENKWKNFSPRDYFETCGQLYVAFHRRSLPHNSGKLLLVPSTLQREIHINTHIRSLRRSADLVVRALKFWHSNFCKDKTDVAKNIGAKIDGQKSLPKKTTSCIGTWNMDAINAKESVFTTVYTADFQKLINRLASGKLKRDEAVSQLQSMTEKLNSPVVNKRAIPGFLPSDRNIYRGICGLAILGSRPSAMTISDSRIMKIPPPNDRNSDNIKISAKRLNLVLNRLGLSTTSDGEDVSLIIKILWKEANEYYNPVNIMVNQKNVIDIESSDHWKDEIELGLLKWLMYGVSANQPSWFSKVCCMPCGISKSQVVFPDQHPASKMNQKSGDLVSHDVIKCNLCRNATGCLPFQNTGLCLFVDEHSMASSASMDKTQKETESEESCTINIENNDDVEVTSLSILQKDTTTNSNDDDTNPSATGCC